MSTDMAAVSSARKQSEERCEIASGGRRRDECQLPEPSSGPPGSLDDYFVSWESRWAHGRQCTVRVANPSQAGSPSPRACPGGVRSRHVLGEQPGSRSPFAVCSTVFTAFSCGHWYGAGGGTQTSPAGRSSPAASAVRGELRYPENAAWLRQIKVFLRGYPENTVTSARQPATILRAEMG